MFDSLSEALCWILTNFHTLSIATFFAPIMQSQRSDFCISGTQTSSLYRENRRSKHIPGISLHHPRLISLQASLPTEKILRISLLISNILLAHRCTKWQLLSLLGYLNYAIPIIPQGRSFLSHLLSIAASIYPSTMVSCLRKHARWSQNCCTTSSPPGTSSFFTTTILALAGGSQLNRCLNSNPSFLPPLSAKCTQLS